MIGIGWFLGGLLVGAKGKDIFGSKDAKKIYSKVLSYGLDAKDCILETTDSLRENLEDVYAEAKEMQGTRAEQKEMDNEAAIIEDTADEDDDPVKEEGTAKQRHTSKKTAVKKTATGKKPGRTKKSE